MIAVRCSEAFASDDFRKIDEDTLIHILKFNRLNITELDLLKACLRWTDSEFERRHLEGEEVDKRTVFGSIKHLVRFNDLKQSDFCSILNLNNYLTMKEIISIFNHISHPSEPVKPDYRSLRASHKTQVANGVQFSYFYFAAGLSHLKIWICVDKRVFVSSIETASISRVDAKNVRFFPTAENLFLSKIVPCSIEPPLFYFWQLKGQIESRSRAKHNVRTAVQFPKQSDLAH